MRHDSTTLHAKIAESDEGHTVCAAFTGRKPFGGLVAEPAARAPEAGGGGMRAWASGLADVWQTERKQSIAATNARLADNIVSINGKLDFPRKFVLNRLSGK